MEHKLLYRTKGIRFRRQYEIPLGKADIKRQGKDLTIITYSKHWFCVHLKLRNNLPKKALMLKLVDLRSLKPLDTETIVTFLCLKRGVS